MQEDGQQKQPPRMSTQEGDAHCGNWFERHIHVMMERNRQFSVRNSDGSLKSHEELTRLAIASQWDQLMLWLDHAWGTSALEWRKELAIYPENLQRLRCEAHVELKRQYKHASHYVYQFEFLPYKAPDQQPNSAWWLSRIVKSPAPDSVRTTALELLGLVADKHPFEESAVELADRSRDMIQFSCPDFQVQITGDGITSLSRRNPYELLITTPIKGAPLEVACRAHELVYGSELI